MIWYYYDESKVRFKVESFAALKKLALCGVVKPDTIIENDVDKTSLAYKIAPASEFQSLKFANENPDEANSLPEVSGDVPVASETSDICKFTPFNFKRRKSLTGITDNFKILTIACFLLKIVVFLALCLGGILVFAGLVILLLSILSGVEFTYVIFSGMEFTYVALILFLGMYCILSAIPILLLSEIIML
ncbi:MAG: hypothetical protein LBK06_07585, partial [Planctomycetaceae bacterium]|nr:hypothetical protein [Planctomycetaceae bacterium]